MFDFIVKIVETSGYIGIALLMFGENLFPPIPSEVIMPMAGFSAARGELQLPFVLLAGIIGSLAGATFWYWIGRRLGFDRVRRFSEKRGHWLSATPADLDKARRIFRRHEAMAVFFGRLMPAVRTLISVPAGVAAMALPRFLFWTSLGTGIWTALLAAAGYVLEAQYQRLSGVLDILSAGVMAALFGWYLYRVVTFKKRVGTEEETQTES